MHLTPNDCVTPINRDYTSVFMKIKECIKTIQNARILTCILRFESVFALPLNVTYYF
jgi:hypothetical protein